MADPLPGTQPLTAQGDLAAQMVAGIDRFLIQKTQEAAQHRPAVPDRARLAKILGLVDPRTPFDAPELIAATNAPALVAHGAGFDAYAVRWPVMEQIAGEGLLLVPTGRRALADVVAIPDADQTPEMIAGLAPGVPAESQFARRLAESACRVIVPTLVDRSDTFSMPPSGQRTNQPHREYVYRPAFEMGRHIIGYEVQKVLAAVDWFARDEGDPTKIGVFGYGEGGLLALDAAALDPRIKATGVSGYFGPREDLWREPIYRNVFGLLNAFGDAEIANLIAPRALVIEACRAPEVSGPPPERDGRKGATPGRLVTPKLEDVRAEVARAKQGSIQLQVSGDDGRGPFGSPAALHSFLTGLGVPGDLAPLGPAPEDLRKDFDPQARLKRQIDQMQEFTQSLVRNSEQVRERFWAKADHSSADKWRQSTEWYRDYFASEIIGRFDQKLLPSNPRTRQIYDEPKYVGFEVMLDVYPDVFAYGILLVPKDIKPGERRPVVVCQHGLEGRPSDVANPKQDSHFYHRFACRLAEQGFVTYAPQNPYIGGDKFRVLQRKAQPIGKTLFSIIVPQHQQTTDWLASLPFVDPDRIAFYGLSYGGKTAMRVPSLVSRYCLSICSGDFNEWIWKTTSLTYKAGYVGMNEYDMYEWDLGETFNYAEMAGLIAPRPFMVERGHRDGVGIDEWVAYEYAKVCRLYADLKIPDRTTIEFFDGPHTIHGVGTFEFLHKQLHWPEAEAR
ncbi:MAG TPA: dienelactone hydrolase family protein [Tepidisphaeraceae bacterium]|jgi:dienelactone hydrolase